MDRDVVHLRSWVQARAALRERSLRQGLYDDAGLLMSDVIVNLDGDEHRDRRRLENRLFRLDTFRWYETEIISALTTQMAAPAIELGFGDLLPIARRTMMKLSCRIAGLDIADQDFDEVFALMDRLARAATVMHATGDHDAVRADGLAALDEVRIRFIEPVIADRRAAIARTGDQVAPHDVISTLLVNAGSLNLNTDTMIREVAYFPWVGSHSTSNAFVHAMDHLFEWFREHPDDRPALIDDPLRLQRFVHESLRLHPASPQTHRIATSDIELPDGTKIVCGARVLIDMNAANRDPDVWGPDAETFDPERVLPADAAPWGLTFGHGIHACLGVELAAGLASTVAPDRNDGSGHLFGAITCLARILLQHGARPDPDQPAVRDPETVRVVHRSYPVRFDPADNVTNT